LPSAVAGRPSTNTRLTPVAYLCGELRRRGRRLPPGAGRPWLLAAALLAGFVAVLAGLASGVGWAVRLLD
jgi:hypothetical protein